MTKKLEPHLSRQADSPDNVWRNGAILTRADCQTVSAESECMEIPQTVSAEYLFRTAAESFPLTWSAYVRLLSVKNEKTRKFYGSEALRGAWSVRQLDRQIDSQFYERTAPKEKAHNGMG